MADGFSVDRAALSETSKGLTGALDQLKAVGVSDNADAGLGFTDLALSQAQAGSTVAKSLSDFCDNWNFGVATLIQDGYQFGQRLGLTVSAYNDAENDIIGGLKDLTASEFGDPWESDSQAEKGSWGQAFAAVDGASTPGSKITAKQALDQAGKEWEGVGHDAVNDSEPATFLKATEKLEKEAPGNSAPADPGVRGAGPLTGNPGAQGPLHSPFSPQNPHLDQPLPKDFGKDFQVDQPDNPMGLGNNPYLDEAKGNGR